MVDSRWRWVSRGFDGCSCDSTLPPLGVASNELAVTPDLLGKEEEK